MSIDYDNIGTGADGDVVISSATDLSADLNPTSLLIEPDAILNTQNFRILCRGTVTIQGIVRNNGRSAIGQTGGASANNAGAGTLPVFTTGTCDGGSGGNYVADGGGAGNPGDPGGGGQSSNNSLGGEIILFVPPSKIQQVPFFVLTGEGGNGQGATGCQSYSLNSELASVPPVHIAGGGSGGAGGRQGRSSYGGTYSIEAILDLAYYSPSGLDIFGLPQPSGGGGGGGGGGASAFGIALSGHGGYGGGRGGNGGWVVIFAKEIIIEGSGDVQSIGGPGGNGQDGGDAVGFAGTHTSGGGGGGGGCPGNAGAIILASDILTITEPQLTFTAAILNGGNAGGGGGGADSGSPRGSSAAFPPVPPVAAPGAGGGAGLTLLRALALPIYASTPPPSLPGIPLRLTSVSVNEKFEVECEAEPFIYGLRTPLPLIAATPSPDNPSSDVSAGDVNTPIIFEAVPALAGFTNPGQLWMVISSDNDSGVDPSGNPISLYGGCVAYMSTDGGASYNPLGPNSGYVYGNATTGTTVGDWPAHADPDTTNDLEVDLTESLGVLDSYSVGQEDAFIYPCYVAGGGGNPITYELMTYALANLTATYKYTLKATGGGTNHLRRGVFGAPLPATGVDHPNGSRFAFLDPADPSQPGVLRVPLNPEWIGVTLYFKFLSFNIYVNGLQTLPEATAYTYTPTGNAGGVNPGGLPPNLVTVN